MRSPTSAPLDGLAASARPGRGRRARTGGRAGGRLLAALGCALAAALPAAGCGRSPASEQGAVELNPVEPVGAGGAAGQVTKNTARLGGASPTIDAAAVASAVHPGAASASRPQAVILADSASWPSALAASVLAAAPLYAPILYSEAKGVPGPTAQALEAMKPTGAPALEGAQVLTLGRHLPAPAGLRTRALAGPDAYTMAAEIARLVEALRGSPPPQVIVVNAEGDAAFAMPAAGLAAESGAPILLVQSAHVPAATRAELKALGPQAIYAIGPAQAMPAGVVKQLERYGPVTRIQGATPAQTAVAVARFSEGSFGWGIHEPGHGLVFANAGRPLDAPAAAPLSASGDFAPLLLLESAEAIPPAVSEYLEDIRGAYNAHVPPVRALYNHGWIIGGASAISVATQATLDASLEVAPRPGATPSPAAP